MKRALTIIVVTIILLAVGGIALYQAGFNEPEHKGVVAVIPPSMDEEDVPRERIAALGRNVVALYKSVRPRDEYLTESSLEAFAKTVNLALVSYEGGQFQDFMTLRQFQGLDVPSDENSGLSSMLRSQAGTILATSDGEVDVEVIHHGSDAAVMYRQFPFPYEVSAATSTGGRGHADVANPTMAEEVVEVKMPVVARGLDGGDVPAILSMFFIRPTGKTHWLYYRNQLVTKGHNPGFVLSPI